MSRKSFKEINPFQSTQTISSEEPERTFDWSLCILCQSITKESLQCPARSKRLDLGAGCKSIAENLQGFFAIGALPFDVTQNQLDDGSGLFNTLLRHEASWHKSCKDKINSMKLKRAEKERTKKSYHQTALGKQDGQAHLAPASAKIKMKSCASFAIKFLEH